MKKIEENFYKYLRKIITLEEFKKWIYSDNSIECQLGEEDYVYLISLDFNSKQISYLIEDFVKKRFDWNEYMKFCRVIEEREADEIKMQTISIDLNEIKTVDELHNILKIKLKLPNFYGNNWNALWDAITGLVTMPMKLELKNWDSFEKRLIMDSVIFKKIIDDFNKLDYIEGKIEIKNCC